MQLLQKENGCALFLNVDELHFVKYNFGNPTIRFVIGLLAFVLLTNGALQWVLGNTVAGSILLILGFVCALLFWKRFKMKHQSEGVLKPTSDNTLLVVDTCEKDIYTGKRIHLGHMSECSFTYNFQMTSSAKSLVFQYPNGKIEIVKGNPFGGMSKPFFEQLKNYNLI